MCRNKRYDCIVKVLQHKKTTCHEYNEQIDDREIGCSDPQGITSVYHFCATCRNVDDNRCSDGLKCDSALFRWLAGWIVVAMLDQVD